MGSGVGNGLDHLLTYIIHIYNNYYFAGFVVNCDLLGELGYIPNCKRPIDTPQKYLVIPYRNVAAIFEDKKVATEGTTALYDFFIINLYVHVQ